MAGYRRPGSSGFGDNLEDIDAGTSCRASTPAPRPVGICEPNAAPTGSGAFAAQSASALQELVIGLLGPQTFGLGIIYGAGENVAGSIVSIAGLARTLLLADLYDRAHQPALMTIGPLGSVQQGIAALSLRVRVKRRSRRRN
jgi:hypothetical protein